MKGNHGQFSVIDLSLLVETSHGFPSLKPLASGDSTESPPMKNIWIALVALLVFVVCPPAHAAASGAHKKPHNIALIIKATDSEFCQYVIIGGSTYGLDHPHPAKVGRNGPSPAASMITQ